MSDWVFALSIYIVQTVAGTVQATMIGRHEKLSWGLAIPLGFAMAALWIPVLAILAAMLIVVVLAAILSGTIWRAYTWDRTRAALAPMDDNAD